MGRHTSFARFTRLLMHLAVLSVVALFAGCHGSGDDTTTPPTITAPINNNAPGAATAPAAPGPSARPGMPYKKGMGGK